VSSRQGLSDSVENRDIQKVFFTFLEYMPPGGFIKMRPGKSVLPGLVRVRMVDWSVPKELETGFMMTYSF
jgi:hypothetical protein